MTVGLQIWDGSGTLIFDETTPVLKFLGTLTIGAGTTGAAASGSITDARFTSFAQHTPFWCRIDGGFSTEYYDANWVFNGNSLIWTYPDATPRYAGGTLYNRPTQTIVYGIR